ncbi:MAG: hypothetical protein LDL31_01845 [Prosthecobacter sp.]|nr:hypothetical protein [Prosthecobacter sp.]
MNPPSESSPQPLPSSAVPASVRALAWKNRHWMTAVLLPAAGLLALGSVGLGYVHVRGTLLTNLFIFGLLPLSFGLPYLFWSQVERQALRWRKMQQMDQEALRAQEARRERARRESFLQRYQRLGMTRLGLEEMPLPSGDAPVEVAALAGFILDHGLLRRAQALVEAGRAGGPVTLLSLALPLPLMWRLAVNEKSFCLDLAEKLRTQALARLSPPESSGIDPQVRERLDASVRFEVWVIRDEDLLERDADFAFLAEKTLMAHDELVHYVVQGRGQEAQEIFHAWQLPVGRAPVREGRTALLLPANASLTALAGDRATALRDLTLSGPAAETHVEVEELHHNRQLQERLGVHVVRQVSPFPLLDSYTSSFKGTIRCVGWWDADGWHPMPEKDIVRSRLSASAPNRLKKGVRAINGDDDSENILLRDLLNLQHEDFGRAVSTLGNFEIRRGPKAQGSPVFKYFIRTNPDSETITRVLRTSGHDSFRAHQDRSRYEEIGTNLMSLNPGPLEQRGFYRLPFSEGYLMTGDSSLQLCLHLDLGSPSLGEGMEAPLQLDVETLPASLAAFARESEALDYELLEENTAQGITARASLPGHGPCYLKLLEAAHTRRYATVGVLDRLMEARVLPRSIRHQRINSRGLPSDRGELHVFVTPACQSVADVLRAGTVTIQQRLALWSELNRFCLRLRERGIFCTDLTLRDLMFEAPSLEAALAQAQAQPQEAAFFVADYGSYIRQCDFTRGTVIVKEEMCAPEDWETSLPYEAEAYQVFLQGILAVQILLADPGYVPAAVMRQHEMGSIRDVQQKLWDEVAARLRAEVQDDLRGLEQAPMLLEMLRRMLSADPTKRPTLKEIAE